MKPLAQPRRPTLARVLVYSAILLGAALYALLSLQWKIEGYCDGKYLMEDLELVGDMNICMATVACNFTTKEVRAYRQATKMINMCSEKAKIEAIPEPEAYLPPRVERPAGQGT